MTITCGQTVKLIAASTQADYDVVKEVLDKNSSLIDVKDEEFGRTPLHWAAAGSDYYSKDKEHQDAIRRYTVVVKLLLQYQPNTECRDQNGWTALLCAAAMGHRAIVDLLLCGRPSFRCSNVDAADGDGRTSLSWSAEQGHVAIARLLIRKRATIESKDKGGRTPLSWAAWNGQEDTVKLLLRKGANLEARDAGGWTPLWWAVARGHISVARLLIALNAEVNSLDLCGRTLLCFVVRSGGKAIEKMLLEHGAILPRLI